jgi:hypothetical protein
MSTLENQGKDSANDQVAASAKTQRVTAVAWLAGITAVIALGTMNGGATLGQGLGVVGVSAMVAIVSYFILR